MNERKYQINHQGPVTINEALPKEHQSLYDTFTLELDGKPAVTGWVARGKYSSFGFYWPNTGVSPSEFFDNANTLIQKLKDSKFQLRGKMYDYSFDYIIDNQEGIQHLETDDTKGISEILENEQLLHAHLRTPHGAFSQDKLGDIESDGFIGAFLISATVPDESVQFIVQNCAGNLSVSEVKELVHEIEQTRQSQSVA